MKQYSYIIIFCLVVSLISGLVNGSTTEVTISRIASDNLTPVMEVTRIYQWMQANLPVHGDGTTHYYSQGPTFDATDPWDDAEWKNIIPDRDWGAVMGTNVADLCDLVGGGNPGYPIQISGSDNLRRDFSYESVYQPNPRQGPLVVTWRKDGMYPNSGYDEGMRLIMFADAKKNTYGWNTSGWHVFGNADMRDSWEPRYWYNFTQYGEEWPSSGGTSVKYVRYIRVFTPDPVPPPVADFSANVRTGHVINGDFETGPAFAPWVSTSGATIYTGTTTAYRKGNASTRLAATVGNPASIQQNVDLTGVTSMTIWRYQFGGTGKYLVVLVDDTPVAYFRETGTVAGKYETIDISSYGFTGIHTLTVQAVSVVSGTLTVYVDDIRDYGPGTSGNAPLSVQFKDLSIKTEDTAKSNWAWDFTNDGVTDSTERNPRYTYTANGIYTVKLTTTNAGGSDSEVKTGYIIVNSLIPPPVASFSVNVTSGTAPLAVMFTDTSTGSPQTWNWSFGDGTWFNATNAAQKNPVYTYADGGSYTAKLMACNTGGCNTTVLGKTITVSQAPQVIPLPGYSRPPTDPDGNGIYEDLNGNGRLDFADVVLYFNQMTWIAANEPISAFDLNGNGRIDFADIVALFNLI